MKKNEIREAFVLKHLVTEFIESNATISSRLLSEKYLPDVSQATLRIDLNKLEKKNLIYQPHTSAGRIPTLKGYRMYLSQIENDLKLQTYDKQEVIRNFLISNYKDTPLALHYIMQLLSKETDQLSFVAEPEISYGYLDKLDVFKIADRKLLFVVSLDSGLDKTVIINIDYDISEQQLKALVRYANEELAGLRVFDIIHSYLEELSKESNSNKLLLQFLTELRMALQEISSYYIHFDGGIEFLNRPEFDEKQNVLQFLDLIQRQDLFIKLMQRSDPNAPYSVCIGEDFGKNSWAKFALVYARYEIFGVPGYLGVIAPIRMNYLKNIPVIRDIANVITETTKKGMMVVK